MTTAELIQELDRLKGTMISVATGGPRIQEVQNEFAQRFDAVTLELSSRGIEIRSRIVTYGNGTDTGAALSRSVHIVLVANMSPEFFEPLIKLVQAGHAVDFEATGWLRVDRTARELRARLAAAQNEEQFQAVGLLCREMLISVAQEVFFAEQHPTLMG